MSGLHLSATGLRLDVRQAAGRRDAIIDIEAMGASPGEVTVLSGPSGSGKSTLLYLLSGLLRPDRGDVAWDGQVISSLSEGRRDAWWLRHAGFVFQNFHLIDEMSPLDNVLMPAWFSRFAAGALRQRAQALLEELGVPGGRGRANLLSRGEQQRVALARALLFDPPVIFADEPTASLDAASGETVARLLLRLATEGRTVLVASHDPAVIASAHRRIALDHGRLTAPLAMVPA